IKHPPTAKKDITQEHMAAWRSRGLYIIAGFYFAVGTVYLIPNIYQTSYMMNLGMSNETAGTVYAIAGIVSIGGAPFWGMLADKM
ncbi:MFS transporter, partial [Lysinibacillus sp. D4A3_S15]|uniref:MFS transporter n=1 Tax=Lysinibacillus sp. D4A3_S15 TaxID=2941227 RepID=UPI0037C9EE9E